MVNDDPAEVARRSAEAMWSADQASKALGMDVERVAPGHARVTMTVRPDMVNGWNLCHGGLIASLADSAFALACNSRGTVTVASGFEINFLESGRLGDLLVAEAHEVALRGRSGIYDVTVRNDSTVIAEFRGRCRSLGRPILDKEHT
ncbi:hydroxyphenylacetyl-CoA thioesterase PaaI [Mycobacterium sp. CBMA293]|uniref:hydroxyphenylacetyl-CoA thioesterase PaaI n=1 Tax=unclassified Mycolicibacterium TaxID=2636767 RepID=UPI0012DE3849|nr:MULTISPECIES: hydroxyphenylacetyl-CoA thioesterase PaaI [unclassified Mycolicibacterium]MUL47161.1 hydroxyphenylacetyl-CoA thioesterase PaaI [Mycolicibacterium sp. CBMA 360]MUL61270.1 hydroxyphenylacetyl-CoA thioesterase PaaI [Mycolicibacterium sp. CBMA 335]MUL72005.1 hydroxyphenylacetyl-CoA thioesterase PaaI [Mycolicibacterium sp. CBMA 311]MUL96172.1 hydroxyphenylacetyl-CoA thioesterase PaaI [Mycolicibacterium sp. CBMA 230]MUM06702.1 phenylacetic acid degradation protein PaaD [Mycolicibact